MNKHNCPVCGKFMMIDWETSIANGEVTFICPDECKEVQYIKIGDVIKKIIKRIEIVDEEATERFWEEIDKQRMV